MDKQLAKDSPRSACPYCSSGLVSFNCQGDGYINGKWVVAYRCLKCSKEWQESSDSGEEIRKWLRDYVAMMEANLGILVESKVEGLYQSIVDRVVKVRMFLKRTAPQNEPGRCPTCDRWLETRCAVCGPVEQVPQKDGGQ